MRPKLLVVVTGIAALIELGAAPYVLARPQADGPGAGATAVPSAPVVAAAHPPAVPTPDLPTPPPPVLPGLPDLPMLPDLPVPPVPDLGLPPLETPALPALPAPDLPPVVVPALPGVPALPDLPGDVSLLGLHL